MLNAKGNKHIGTIDKSLFPAIQEDGTLSYKRGGIVFCNHCQTSSGVKVRNYWRKDQLRISVRCVKCKALEIRDNHTGEILRQEVDMMVIANKIVRREGTQ